MKSETLIACTRLFFHLPLPPLFSPLPNSLLADLLMAPLPLTTSNSPLPLTTISPLLAAT